MALGPQEQQSLHNHTQICSTTQLCSQVSWAQPSVTPWLQNVAWATTIPEIPGLQVQQRQQLMVPFPLFQNSTNKNCCLLLVKFMITLEICFYSIRNSKCSSSKVAKWRQRRKERWCKTWLGSWTEKKEYSHMEKERNGMEWKEDESERLSLLLEPVMGMIWLCHMTRCLM